MRLLIALLALAMALPAVAVDVRPLDASQIPALLAPPAHGERLLALWSLECVYCEGNLQALARLQRAHPGEVELVTVATDGISADVAIAERLHKAGMDSYAARAFTDDTPDRLNYLLDPRWGGELPRVLVIRADGSRHGYSGLLDATTLRKLQP